MRLSLLLLAFISQASWALLQVYPTRVILGDKKLVTTISLRHVGQKPGRYQVSAVFYKMRPDGGIEQVSDPGMDKQSIAKSLRFSPRETLIPPGQEQVVRVMYAGPRNLPDGDYRAHLHFEPIGDTEGIPANAGNQKIDIKLEAKLAVAIPVIFHRGNTAFTASLSNPRVVTLPDKNRGLSVQLQVKGTGTPFGDFFALFTPEGGKEQNVGLVRGIASYIPERTVSFPLNAPKNYPLSKGKLKIEYREPEEAGAKVLAALEVKVP